MLLQKHFKAIAQAVKDSEIRIEHPDDPDDFVDVYSKSLPDKLADYFQQENPRFDRIGFLQACGLPV